MEIIIIFKQLNIIFKQIKFKNFFIIKKNIEHI